VCRQLNKSCFIKIGTVIGLLLLYGCAGTASNLQPLTESSHDYGLTEAENSLLNKSVAAHQELESKGLILTDEAVNEFVRQTGTRVTPVVYGNNINIRFYVLKDSTVNAMAFPNGNIYINVGLLARLENESQLAHVLSHEVAHVVQRHSLKGAVNRSSTIVAAHITDLLLFGTSIGYLPYLSSLSGFSQEQELEADKYALQYMYGSHYNVEESINVFKTLQETSAVETIKGSIYSSHPTNKLRIEQSEELIQKQYAIHANASSGDNQFKLVRRNIERLNLQLQLTSKKYQMTIDNADKVIAGNTDDPWIWYYKAEAYRLMAKYPKSAAHERAWMKGNGQSIENYEQEILAQVSELLGKARETLAEGVQRAGDIPQFHRCRGLIAYDAGDMALAREELNEYLNSGLEIKDRLFIERQLQKTGG
jgi:predicted Zn-dependent protease